jgi:hypothetical protein
MSPADNTASTAIERARLAYEQMKRRQYNAVALQRARDRSRNIKLVVTAVTMIVLFLGISIHNDWLPTSLRSSAQEPRMVDNSKFGETRIAPIRSFVKGNTCQEMQFNNDLGIYVQGALVPCEVETKREPYVPLLPSPGKGVRANSVRDGFTK